LKSCFIIITCLFAVSISSKAAALSLESCAAIEHPAERLACYDRLSGRLPADTTEASGKTPATVTPAAPKADVIVPAVSSPVATPAAPAAAATPAAPAAATTSTAAAPAEPPTAPAVEPTPHAETVFGLEHKEERPEEMQFKWARKKKDAYGKWIITLENGQIWRQTDSARFSFRNPKKQVVISRGFMDSFFLGEPGRNTKIRVKRIK
jgi:hypothetical protein